MCKSLYHDPFTNMLQEIVESVVKNSTSFSERNEFSQEKYVKRKQRK